MATDETTLHQAIHPSLRPLLDPEYVSFHDEHLQYVLPSEAEAWDPASRMRPSPMGNAEQKHVEVGSVYDKDLGDFQIRVFTPEGDAPEGGWQVLVWFHGGGWVMGGLGSENGFLRHVCKCKSLEWQAHDCGSITGDINLCWWDTDVKCVVVSINYRHAPEHVYPAAVNDVVAGYQWVVATEHAKSLGINTSKIAIGGLSA
jgi:acetyl esterase/lipase